VTSLLSTQGTSHIRNVQEGEHSKAYEFFYNDNGNDGIYKTLYNDCINTIAKEYHANLKDTDWNTLICVDEELQEPFLTEEQNIIVVNSLDIKSNICFRAIVDSSLIFQSASRISNFLRSFTIYTVLNII